MNVVPRASQWGELIQPDRVHGSLYTDPAIFAAELREHLVPHLGLSSGTSARSPSPTTTWSSRSARSR